MTIERSSFAVVDTETTGLDSTTEAIVEVAAIIFQPRLPDVSVKWLVNPGKPIPAAASAVHHITDDMVQDCGEIQPALTELYHLVGPDRVLVAHFAEFDRKFIQAALPSPHRWLCTCRLARHLWPEAPSHGNQQLRDWLKLEVDTKGELAHRAGADTLVTAALLRVELDVYESRFPGATLEDLLTFAESPIIYQRMPFGKHRGTILKALPVDYVSWVLENLTLDNDLRASLIAACPGAAWECPGCLKAFWPKPLTAYQIENGMQFHTEECAQEYLARRAEDP